MDVLLRGSRIAVLVHGCFWHRCPEHFHAPKANAEWWRLKLESVVARDADTLVTLVAAGWLPVVVWEHEDVVMAAGRIRDLDAGRRSDIREQPVSARRLPSAAPAGRGPVVR